MNDFSKELPYGYENLRCKVNGTKSVRVSDVKMFCELLKIEKPEEIVEIFLN